MYQNHMGADVSPIRLETGSCVPPDRPGKTGCRHSFSLCEQSETKVSRLGPGVKNTSYKSKCACVREGPGVSYSLRMHLSPDICTVVHKQHGTTIMMSL